MTPKRTRLFIATPMYGGMCAGSYAQSIVQSIATFSANNIETSFSFMFNESLITRARNALVNIFMKNDFDYLMFIDADIRFNPEHIVHMIHADKDIICGIYPKKEINWGTVKMAMDNGVPFDQIKNYTGSFVVNLVDYATEVTVRADQPVEIFNGGTGFMLIKRSVFEKMAERVPSYFNDVVDLAGSMQDREEIKEYFTTSIEPFTQRLLSEDYHFCRTWREMDGQIFAAPWCDLAHVGTFVFEGKLLPSP
jgi:hypothetical protein